MKRGDEGGEVNPSAPLLKPPSAPLALHFSNKPGLQKSPSGRHPSPPPTPTRPCQRRIGRSTRSNARGRGGERCVRERQRGIEEIKKGECISTNSSNPRLYLFGINCAPSDLPKMPFPLAPRGRAAGGTAKGLAKFFPQKFVAFFFRVAGI